MAELTPALSPRLVEVLKGRLAPELACAIVALTLDTTRGYRGAEVSEEATASVLGHLDACQHCQRLLAGAEGRN